MKEITYHKEGDYLIPDLSVKGTNSDYHIGLYGRLRLEYLKKNRLGLYTDLILNGTLPSYLNGIDERCNHIVNITVREMAKENNVNEELKRTDQLKWVGLMNNFKNSAEEIVFNEIIYV